jgi:beta-xylosidase
MTSLLLTLALLSPQNNPVFPGADPHAAVVGDTVWLYPTDGTHRIGAAFWAYSSKDLKTWTWHGAWAPALAQRGKKFYLYYSVGPQNPTPARLGVAVAESPAGPFRDLGKPLFTGGNGFEAIDPMVFRDPKSGRYLLYAGGSAGAKLRVWELDDTMMGFRREIPVDNPKEFTEGVFMHYRKGTYYLTYSHGGWRDSSYSVYYATANNPFGPWNYRGKILGTGGAHKGPGHWSVFQKPKTDDWYVAYHEWPGRTGDGPYSGNREIAFGRLTYTKGGLIEPVQPVDAIPAWR